MSKIASDRVIMILILLGANLLAAPNIFCSEKFSAEKNNHPSIDACDYVRFLNATAACDLNHLYDEKMNIGAGGASILRSGAPGNYRYAVVTSTAFSNGDSNEDDFKNTPMLFLSDQNAKRYSNISKTDFVSSASPDVIDEELRASDVTFVISSSRQSSGEAIVGELAGGAFGELLSAFVLSFEITAVEISTEERGGNQINHVETNNHLLTNEPQSRLDGRSQPTTMETIVRYQDPLKSEENGLAVFSSKAPEPADGLFAGKKIAAVPPSKKMDLSIFPVKSLNVISDQRKYEEAIAGATSSQEKKAYQLAIAYHQELTEELDVNGDSERAKSLQAAAQIACSLGEKIKNNMPVDIDYELKRASMFVTQGREAGTNFTVEKYQQQKDEADKEALFSMF